MHTSFVLQFNLHFSRKNQARWQTEKQSESDAKPAVKHFSLHKTFK